MEDLRNAQGAELPVPVKEDGVPNPVQQEKELLNAQKAPEEEKELLFELGLVMAGAYTAGVIDFLLKALEALELAKEKEKDLPPMK